MNDFRKRILEPLVIPMTSVVFIGGLVWGLSRFLLVTDKDMAVAVAFVVSFGILVVAAFLAQGTFGSVQKVALALLGIGIAAGGTVTAATLGIRPFERHVKAPDFVLVAKAPTTFVQTQIPLDPKEKKFNVLLDNQEAGVAHNFALYRDEKRTQVVFKGKIFPGIAKQDNEFENPGPGRYYFQCDVHPVPAMQGTASIGEPRAPGGPLPSGGPPPGGPPSHGGPSPTGTPTAGLILAIPLLRRRTSRS